MKYFKFTQIDAATGISWAINQPISGPSMPNIPGLKIEEAINLSFDKIYYVAKVDDSAQENRDNYCFEITFQEYAKCLNDHITHILNERLEKIHLEEIDFRNSYFEKYHQTVYSNGLTKYEEAKQFLLNSNSEVKDLRLEASVRNVSVQSLAEKIIEKYEKFKEDDAKISGIRGKIMDRIKNFKFNFDDPDISYNEFLSNETLGTIEVNNEFDPISSSFTKKTVNVETNKYILNISTRFQYS